MASLNKPVPGGDIGTWGVKVNNALDALNTELIGTTSTANAAETPTGAQTKVTNAINGLGAVYEAKVPRTGASTGWLATLKADGTIYFTAPAAGTTLPDASSSVKGLTRLTNDLGGTADAPTTPTAAHKASAETITGLWTYSTAPNLPDGSVPVSKLVAAGTRDATTFLRGDGQWVPAGSGGTGSSTQSSRSGSFTLVAGDANSHILVNAPATATVTVPTNATVPFPLQTEVRLTQYGAGQVQVASAGASTGSVPATVYVRSSVSTQRSSFSSACAVLLPPTIATGDGLLVHLATSDETETITPPTGWVQVGTANGPSGAGGYLFRYQNAPSSLAGTTVTFTIASSGAAQTTALPFAASALALAGADPTNFIDGHWQTGTTPTQNTPAGTTTAAGCLELGLIHSASAATIEPAATYSGSTLVSDTQTATSFTSNNARESVAHGTAGPVPAGTVLASKTSWSSGGYGGARTVSVKPATTTGTTGGAVAIRTPGTVSGTAAQYASAVLTKIGTDEWLLDGYVA